MFKRFIALACYGASIACSVSWGVTVAEAVTLDPECQKRVRTATFEVVMKKPERDSLRYEREPPLELLPYTERTDKYISVGTAFALGESRFVTAAHVLRRGFSTAYGRPALRSTSGTVYEIGEIFAFSEEQDFAVFSSHDGSGAVPFEPHREWVLDQPVFAVGNALGQGIVIRDGLLTSQTPEQLDGRWQWIRFSAAASPGNSGGPLLDERCGVIGVVLGKSQNENLNYAAPIGLLLDAPQGVAILGRNAGYHLPIFNARQSGRFEAQIDLPKGFDEFATEVLKVEREYYFGLRDELLSKNADTLFPRGTGSTRLLYNNSTPDTLSLIFRKDDGQWDFFFTPQSQVTQLTANGYVAGGRMGDAAFARIRRPDDADVATFYFDSAAYMDMLLKAMSFKRSFGPEEVRVVSMGKAREESEYVDQYGRKWQLRLWESEYHDMVFVSMALPTPEGYLAMTQWASQAQREFVIDDMRWRASFAHFAYNGSLEQWKEYLALEKLLPHGFETARIDFELGRFFKFSSPRFTFEFSNEQQKILPESSLRVSFSYFKDGDAVVWDVTQLMIAEDLAGRQAVGLNRYARPPANAPQEYLVAWERVSAREFPFNGEVIEGEGISSITAVYPMREDGGEGGEVGDVLYLLSLVKSGKHEPSSMQATLDQCLAKLKVHEID